MKRKRKPPHIDGNRRMCCGGSRRVPQCEDCPMKQWDLVVEKEQAFRAAVADRKTHPETARRLWEEYTEAWHRVKEQTGAGK